MKPIYKALMLMVGLTGPFFVIGLTRPKSMEEPSEAPRLQPSYVSGTIKGERYEYCMLASNKYYFTLKNINYHFSDGNVENGPGSEHFMCSSNSEQMDSLLDPGDQVKLRIRSFSHRFDSLTPRSGDYFEVNLEDVVELNGQVISSR